MKYTSIMFCYARSGGTLLNRCLGSLPDTVIMSEVNQLMGAGNEIDSLRTIQTQAKGWYNIQLKNSSFSESLRELHQLSKKDNFNLIIRDWSFVNFVPKNSNSFEPPNKLLSYEEFKNETDFKFFAFVRDSVDVWLSMEKSPVKNGDRHLEYLLKFILELKRNNIKIFKYEDFCANPDKVMKEICEYIDIPFNNSYSEYNSFTKFNGDSQAYDSRGMAQTAIKPLTRRELTDEEASFIKNHTKMSEINEILGYSINP